MPRIAALDSIAHHDLRVAMMPAAHFGDAVNQVAILPTEIEDAQRDFPLIVRRDAAGALALVALTGLDRDENLFLDDAGGWAARHIPLMIQKGPFLVRLHDGEDGGADLHIDLDHPRVGADDGQPLFLPHGGHTLYLEHVVRVLRAIHLGAGAAPAMLAAWDEAGLLEDNMLRISLDETTHWTVPDALLVAPERLAALDGAALQRLNAQGFLRPAFLVSASLGNIARLVELKRARRG